MPFNKDYGVITVVRKGSSDDPYLQLEDTLIIDHSAKVQLTEYPSPFHKVTVTGEDKDWYETDSNLPDVNSYKVDYENKVVTFNIANIGKQLVFSYMGMGNRLISVDNIYVERNGDTVIETLGDIIETGKSAIENLGTLQDTIVEAETATNNANLATTNANNSTTLANQAISEVNTLIDEVTSAESIRENNELNRINEESTRNTSEQSRVDNELIRQQNETNRNATFDSKIIEVNDVISDANVIVNDGLSLVNNLESIGTFNISNQYYKNNIVLFNGSSWIALQDTQNNPLPILPVKENTWWRLHAERGNDGDGGSVHSVNGIFADVNGNVTLPIVDINVIDNVNSTSNTDALSANQGKILNEKFNNYIPSSEKGIVNGVAKLNADGKVVDALGNEVEGKVTSVNGQIGDVVIQDASTTQKGIVQLNDTITSTSTTEALTANQGKVLDDKIGVLTDEISNIYSLTDGEITKVPLVNDFNTILESGFYTVNGDALNAPRTLTDFKWVLQVIVSEQWDSNFTQNPVYQIAYNHLDNQVFRRFIRGNGQKIAWQRLDVQLDDSIDSSVSTIAASANAVKQLNDIKANKQQEDWIDVVYTLGTPTSDANKLQYYKDELGIVHLEGASNTSSKMVSFQMPVGYRPEKRTYSYGYILTAISGYIDLQTNGLLFYTGNADGEVKFNISYRAREE